MVVDAEVAANRGDGDALVVHPNGRRSDPLVHRHRHDKAEFSLERKLGNGAKPLRTCPNIKPKSFISNNCSSPAPTQDLLATSAPTAVAAARL